MMKRLRVRTSKVRDLLGRLSPLVRNRRTSIAFIVGASVGAGLAEAGVLALIAYTATAMSSAGDSAPFDFGPVSFEASTPALLIIASSLALIRLLLQLILAYLPARLAGSVQSRLRTELISSYLDASWSEKATEQEGHLQEVMGTQTTHAGSTVLTLAAGLAAGLEFLILVIAALVLSPEVALIVMATAGILFAGLRPLSRRVRRRSKATSEASLQQSAAVAESVRMAEEIEVFGAGPRELQRVIDRIRALEKHYVATRSLSRMVPFVYQSSMIFLLIGGLAILYAVGTEELATLGAVVLLLVRASAYGQQFQIAYQGFGEAIPYLDRTMRAIERFEKGARHRGRQRLRTAGRIEFQGVSFGYRESVPVLSHLTLAIESREAVGVIGPSGAGKSTMLQLILRLREPSEGIYTMDGTPAAEFDHGDWHRKVAFLPQQPRLLNAKVAENIRFFRDWIDDATVERAARLAHVHDDVMSWPLGYETLIGDRANAVSGGQRQRLCLARALAGSPELLLLDEPTSSLDPRSERLIQESLEGIAGSLTLVIVAHSLATLKLCDRVMVIRGGRLESFGSTELLYRSNDFYRQSVELALADGRMSEGERPVEAETPSRR